MKSLICGAGLACLCVCAASAQDDEQQAMGAVEGQVLDAQTKEGVSDARVVASSERTYRTKTDLNGQYKLKLLPGKYRLSISAAAFVRPQVREFEVTSGQSIDLSHLLELDGLLFVEETLVTTRFDMNSTAAQLEARRASLRVEDALSAEQMSRSPDSNAGDSARRVPGATVMGNKLIVRGLGGRYTQILLNGTTLPGSDPDSTSADLDMVPTSMLQSMSIAKTFSADMPGDFVGGSMRLRTRTEANEDQLSLSLSTGLHSESAFASMPADSGGSLDVLGFDDGTRSLPDSAQGRPVELSREGYRLRTELDDVARQFPNRWALESQQGTPDLGLGLRLSQGTSLFGRPAGVILQTNYSLRRRRRTGNVRALRLAADSDGQSLETRQELEAVEGRQTASIGAFGALSMELSDTDRVSVVSLWNHRGTTIARVVDGWGENEGGEIEALHLEYQERDVLLGQLMFEHDEVLGLSGLSLRWQLGGSLARRDTPDMRDLLRLKSEQFSTWLDVPGSGERLYSKLSHRELTGRVDAKLRLSDALVLKAGAFATLGDRDFRARRFGMDFIGDDTSQRNREPEDLFAPSNVGSLVRMRELTRDSDGYDGTQRLLAGYVMSESKITDALRASAGVRVETFSQGLVPSSIRGVGDGASRADVDLLPSASAALEFASEHFLRFGYGATVARPALRELSPFLFQDYVRRRTVQGNPDLKRTYVHNGDLRWEHLPTEPGGQASGEVFALSLFYKHFSNPIESVIQDRQGNLSFENIDGAQNLGGEAEVRLGLDRLSDILDGLFVGANVALLHSSAELSEEQRGKATSSSRPLAGQSPYLANGSLGYAPDSGDVSFFAYYNVFGARVVEVGKLGLPDVYEEPMHTVDLSFGLALTDAIRLTLSAQNVLQQKRTLTQGGTRVREERVGTTTTAKITGSL